MRGSLNFPGRFPALLAATVLLLGGCGGEKETAARVPAGTTFQEFLRTSERSFQPSLYDPPIDSLVSVGRAYAEPAAPAGLPAPAVAETIPGFRVQVLLTQDIDRATATRDSLAGALPAEWVYLTFDLPYYKVRVGNYADRESANDAVRRLVALGYADAWVVPDKVVRNPLPPSPPAPPDSSGR